MTSLTELIAANYDWTSGRWQPRCGSARAHALPPGSLGLVASLRALLDDRFYLRQSERYGPVFKIAQFFRPTVCIVGLERAVQLLRVHEGDLRAPPLPFNDEIPRGFLRYMTRADHDRYSPLFQAAFSHDIVRACEDDVRAIMRATLVAMAEASRMNGAVDPRPYIRDGVFAALGRTVLGVRFGSTPLREMEEAYRDLDFSDFSARARDRNHRCAEHVARLIRGLAPQHARQDEPPASFLAALLRERPDALDDPTVVGNLTFILDIAHDNVSGLLGWLCKILGEHPVWMSRLRDLQNEDDQTAADLARRIVTEALRMEQSEYIYRVAQRDVRVDDYTIPAGWLIRICVRESHRSQETYVDPDRFDPDRFRDRTFGKNQYAPFGLGRHTCIGAHLAMTTGRLFVEEVARGFDWQTSRDGKRRRLQPRHWSHWSPSARFRMTITHRASDAHR